MTALTALTAPVAAQLTGQRDFRNNQPGVPAARGDCALLLSAPVRVRRACRAGGVIVFPAYCSLLPPALAGAQTAVDLAATAGAGVLASRREYRHESGALRHGRSGENTSSTASTRPSRRS